MFPVVPDQLKLLGSDKKKKTTIIQWRMLLNILFRWRYYVCKPYLRERKICLRPKSGTSHTDWNKASHTGAGLYQSQILIKLINTTVKIWFRHFHPKMDELVSATFIWLEICSNIWKQRQVLPYMATISSCRNKFINF